MSGPHSLQEFGMAGPDGTIMIPLHQALAI
jgi:hypothetical protein